MSYSKRHAGRVNDKGELVILDPAGWRADVSRHKGRDVFVTVVRQQRLHTANQRKYYFGVVVEMIAEYIGEDRESTHKYLKEKFLPKRQIELLDGKKLDDFPPTTRFNTVEEETAYIEDCRRFGAEFLGLYIPGPNEVEVRL